MNMKTQQSEQTTQGSVINITEVFDTTPERLFEAWTNEEDFAAWYGPEDFEVIQCKLDVRVGGHWRAGIVNKAGDEYWMEGEYVEIMKGEKLVFTFNDGSVHKKPEMETLVTIHFTPSGDQTIMHFNQSTFKTVESRDNHFRGWSSGFICLRNHIDRAS
jgi:uncharacterized protein YndB with AHSA1/START domain